MSVPGEFIISHTDVSDDTWVCGRIDDVITSAKLAYYGEKLLQELARKLIIVVP